MRNDKYFEERRVGDLIRLSLNPISIEPLRGVMLRPLSGVYESFARNVNRAYALAMFPSAIAITTLMVGQRAARALYEELGTFSPEKIPVDRIDSIRLRMTPVNQESNLRIGPRKITRLFSSALEVALERADPKTIAGMDSIMPSLLVMAWTSFECLAEDLLEAAIDIRPQWLSPLTGRGKLRKLRPWEVTIAGKSHATSNQSKGPAKRERLSYRTVNAIRDSYWLAFPKNCVEIDKAINHRSIDTLFAVRNILVHKGGIVDGIFLKRTANVPYFSHATIDKELKLDFSMVKTLIDPVFAHGIELMSAVSKWLIKHPDEQAP